MAGYSHRERIEMIAAGQRPDRFAASFWRHFYHLEHHVEGTVQAMVDFQKRFDWDFVKINMRADYHVEDWGLKQEWSRNEFKKHRKYDFPVKRMADWSRIEPLEPTAPALAEHLEVVRLIRKAIGKDTPILMTVFTPLAVAGRMVEDNQMLIDHLRTDPQKIATALQAITETFTKYAAELRNAGADGLFYATTQWASADAITWDEYQEFGVPYDLEVIKATESDALNLLHVCSSNNYLKKLAEIDYHSAFYNWDSHHPTNLPLDSAISELPGRVLVGGVDHRGWLQESNPDEIRIAVDRIKKEYEPSRLIIGPGCSIPPETPMENLQAIREQL